MAKLTKEEMELLKVIKNELETSYSKNDLEKTKSKLKNSIQSSEQLLKSMNIDIDMNTELKSGQKRIGTQDPLEAKSIKITPFDDLLKEATTNIPEDVHFTDIFTEKEMEENFDVIRKLNNEFNAMHRLDQTEWAISIVMGLLAAAIDILLVGVPEKGADGTKAGTMSNWIRTKFDEAIPEEEVKRLEKLAKVPYDASMNVDNKGNPVTDTYVDGLTPYFHRLVSLGHDPFLGLIVGVLDVLSGTMTTVDRKGNIVRQMMPGYEDRVEEHISKAIIKVINHFKSDMNTSMGLPAPLMSIFNLFQFGEIGELDQTIAEIVQGMYYDGFDFIHFVSSSVPVTITELGVRMLYSIKRIKEGHSIKESIPITSDRTKRPKLGTMLYTSHTIASAVNAGKVTLAFKTGAANPFLSINYPQWLAFMKVSFQQIGWTLIEKPELRHNYVLGIIEDEKESLYQSIDDLWSVMEEDFVFD